jgi:hypothetical protein
MHRYLSHSGGMVACLFNDDYAHDDSHEVEVRSGSESLVRSMT